MNQDSLPDETRRRLVCVMSLASASLALQAVAGCGGGHGEWMDTLSCQGPVPYRGPAVRAPLPDSAYPAGQADPLVAPAMAPERAAALELCLAGLLQDHGGPAFDVALFSPEHGLWWRRMGHASLEPLRTVNGQTAFWWASVGKTLTAAMVLQCVSEGVLSLSDRLSRWVPAYPKAQAISLASLLDHTNGTLSYNHPDALGATQHAPYRRPEELLALPMRQGNLFCAGERFGYSNTGYLLLALVLEAVRGEAFHRCVEHQLAGPLALTQLRALAPGPAPADLALPHVEGRPRAVPGLASLMGAGNIVGSARDMLRFWHALLCGRLLPATLVHEQFARLLPMGEDGLWYGQGVMVYDFHDRNGTKRLWLGHSGGAAGTNSLVLHEPARAAFVAVSVNGSVSASAVAMSLLEAMEQAG